MVTLRALVSEDAEALTRVYSGASVRYTTGQTLSLDQAHGKVREALARAAETPRAQWSWSIVREDDVIGLISVRRRSLSMGTVSYILRDDTWGHGYATEATQQVVAFAFANAGLSRLEAMHHPSNPASGRVLNKAGFTHTGTYDYTAPNGSVTKYPAYALQRT
ncbi:GNAT family N-acetyltransferase [Streptomyces lavendulae]|uniref:GNAT family N-acetyltransferase n=1 Tax=Streptomyces lavendulae TaxID=1914 RepID=UPI0033F5C745